MFLLYNKSLDFQKPHKSFIPCQVIFNLRLIPAQWLKPFRNGSVLKNLLPKQVIYNIRFLRNNLFILNISRKKTNSHRIIRICRPKIVFKDLFKTFFRLKLSLLEAKLCRFLLLQLTWNTLYYPAHKYVNEQIMSKLLKASSDLIESYNQYNLN